MPEADFMMRPAEARDLAAILELERETPTAAHWSEEQYRRLFSTGERIVIVAESATVPRSDSETKSPIYGFLVAHAIGPEWELENLVVAPFVRRRGLGKCLIAELIARALSAKVHLIFLEVRESNQPARALYENAGFAPHARRNSYYANPPESALVYRRDLSRSLS
jgi:ribosomal protein S18 acetylase RimI-like enzyme